MKSKLFIAIVAIATVLFVSCKKNEVLSEKTKPSKIEVIQEKITDSEVKPMDVSILKSSSNTKTYSFTSCLAFIYVDIPVNSDKTIKIEVYENTGIGGGLNIDSWPSLNVAAVTNLPSIGVKKTMTVSRASLGTDKKYRLTIRPNGCGYATGKIVLLTY